MWDHHVEYVRDFNPRNATYLSYMPAKVVLWNTTRHPENNRFANIILQFTIHTWQRGAISAVLHLIAMGNKFSVDVPFRHISHFECGSKRIKADSLR